MSYSAVGNLGALGWTGEATISIPAIGTKKVSIDVPLEKMVKSAANEAISAAWPALKKTLEKEAETELPKLIKQNLPTVMAMVQPAVRKEIDHAISKGTKIGAILGIAIVGSIVASAIWVRSGSKQK